MLDWETRKKERKGLVGTLSSAERLARGSFGSSCRRCCQRQSSTCQMRAVVTRGDFDRHHRWARDGGARAEAWCRFNRSHWLPKMSQRYSQCCCLFLVCISVGQSARTRSSIRFSIFLNSFIFILFFLFFRSFLLIIFKKKKVFSTLFLSLFGIREITAAAHAPITCPGSSKSPGARTCGRANDHAVHS